MVDAPFDLILSRIVVMPVLHMICKSAICIVNVGSIELRV